MNLYLYAVVWVLRASEDIKVFRNACLSFEMQRKTHLLLEQHSLSYFFFLLTFFQFLHHGLLCYIMLPVQRGGIQLSWQPFRHKPELVLQLVPILHFPQRSLQLSP